MTRLLISVFAGLVLVVLCADPAAAQSRRELAARIDALEARLAEAEGRSLAGDPVAEELLIRMDDLERAMRGLTSDVERLEFENRQLRDEVDRLTRRLQTGAGLPGETNAGPATPGASADPAAPSGADAAAASEGAAAADPDDPFAEAKARATRRLGAPETMGAPEPLTRPEDDVLPAPMAREDVGAAPETVPDAPDLFRDGRNALLDGDFIGAQEEFERFVSLYPDHALTGESQYWLGETHFVQGAYADAADAYIASLRADGDGEKAPDALIRLAASLAAMGETGRACDTLDGFSAQFPDASEDVRRKAEREAVRAGCR